MIYFFGGMLMNKYDVFKNFDYKAKVDDVIGIEAGQIIVSAGNYFMYFEVRLNGAFRPEIRIRVCDKERDYVFQWLEYGRSLSEDDRAWLIEFRSFCVEFRDNRVDAFRDSNKFLDYLFS